MDSALVSPELLPRHPYALTVTDVADELCVDPAAGLSEGEVERRRRQFGPNLIPTRKPVSDARLIARQFASPVVALLSMATAVSFVFGEWRQATAVVIVLLINAAIGYGTERRAVRSLDALRALGGRNARVRRGGRAQLVAAEALVPGDVVLFEAGDVVPADVRCLSAAALGVDESALTGESVPVDKGVEPNPPSAGLHQRTALMFKGTHVVRGSGEGIVIGTGTSTELGRITSLVEQVDEGESPLEGQLARLSRQLIWLTVFLAAGVAGVGLLSDKPLLLMVQTAIALAVAAIPEGLPIVATLALARGMLRMARRNALVEKLSAVETLGSTTVVLTDKTGTLTENRMAVERVLTLTGDYSFDYAAGAILTDGVQVDSAADTELMRALLVGVLCANADYDADRDTGSGDPMEVALLRAAGLAGLRRGQELGSFPEVVEYPFDASTKRMVTVHRIGDRYFAAVKGAPEVVLAQADRAGAEACPFGAGSRHEWLDRADRMAADGLRVLAVAMHPSVDPGQPVNGGLTFLGPGGLPGSCARRHCRCGYLAAQRRYSGGDGDW